MAPPAVVEGEVLLGGTSEVVQFFFLCWKCAVVCFNCSVFAVHAVHAVHEVVRLWQQMNTRHRSLSRHSDALFWWKLLTDDG